MRVAWLVVGLLCLVAIEIIKVYFIMPFPGSQRSDTVAVAYFLHNYLWWLRILGVLTIIRTAIHYYRNGKRWQKYLLTSGILVYLFIVYMFNFRFLADKMFRQPKEKIFVTASADTTHPDKLVIGVLINGEARAYPIQVIGYHHQVRDTVGSQPIIVTYCTVCRTGRVFSPLVNGKEEQFRLVGMDHFNAMFEDAATGSWWQQATGMAIAGPLKGKQLIEIPSAQMRLADWIALYPGSKVMQPDSNYAKRYAGLKGYEDGTIKGSLEHRDSLSWQFKSWVVGVVFKNQAKAYDWNELVTKKMIVDSLAGTPLLLTMEPNGRTFYVLDRNVEGQSLGFVAGPSGDRIEDIETHSYWSPAGLCTDGPKKGTQLQRLQAYQEFWHSWQYFHPNTLRYGKP